MMRGWQTLIRGRAVKSFAALIVLAALMAVPLPQTIALWQGQVEAAPPSQTPPGQLQRRGLVGNVTAVETSASTTPITVNPNAASTVSRVDSAATISVETRWRIVDVTVPEGTPVRSPLQGDIDLNGDLVGSKVAILLDKDMVTALKIMVVPHEAVRTHARAAVKARLKDKLQIVSEDGQEIEVEDDGELEEGEDVILVAHRDDSSRGERARLVARSLRKAVHISERLVRITDRIIEEADAPRLEKLKDRIQHFQEQQEKRLARIEERLSELRGDNPNSPSVESRPRQDNTTSLDGEKPVRKQRREKITNLLDRIETAVVARVKEAPTQPQEEERPRDRVRRLKAEVKERAKERLIEVRDRLRNSDEAGEQSVDERTDAQDGRIRASNVLDRIIGSTGDGDVAEANVAVDENEEDSTSDTRLRDRVTDEIKREIRDRLDDGSVSENEEDSTSDTRLRDRVTDEIKREIRDRLDDASECLTENNRIVEGCEVGEDGQLRQHGVIQRVQEAIEDRRNDSTR